MYAIGLFSGLRQLPLLHPARYPVEDRGKDQSVLTHIQRLAAEEHGLFEKESLADEERKRLADIQVQLDQCWDLLRQRRALRETGGDPSQAHVRPPEVIKKYLA
jgi:hypothetical protein